MNKAKMTYRFEHQVQPVQSDPASAKQRQDTNPSDRDAEGNIIPLFREDFPAGTDKRIPRDNRETEADRIERMIRSSGSVRQGTGAGRGEPDGDDASVPDRGGMQVYEGIDFVEETDAPGYVTYRRSQTHHKKDGASLVLSGIGAILTGILIGTLIFSFFRGDAGFPAASSESGNGLVDGSLIDVTAGGDQVGGETGMSPEDGTVSVGMIDPDAVLHQLPEHVYYVVQNGVFRSRAGADTAADQLRDKGLAGAVEEGDIVAVYAGMAGDRDDALLVAQQLQAEQMEMFIKPYVLPEISLPVDSGAVDTALLAYVAEGRKLADGMLAMTLRHMGKSSPEAIPDGHWQELKAAHQRWTAAANQLPDLAEDRLAAASQAMDRAMAGAMAAMEQYAKSPSETYLWQVQSALLDHLIAQKRMLELLLATTGEVTPGGHPA